MDLTTVFWSVDSLDWKLQDVGKIVENVEKKVKSGDIVLMHDIFPTSVEAALQLVDHLSRQGYQFVTVEELLWLNGITPEAGRMYRTGKG